MAGEAPKVASEKPEPAEVPAQPKVTNLTINVDAKPGPVKKEIKLQQDAKGNITGGEVTETPDNGRGE